MNVIGRGTVVAVTRATQVPHIFKEETLLDFYLNSDCSINAAAD
jgi:hypothetical protein